MKHQDIEAAIGERLRLPVSGAWEETWHRLDRPSAYAAIAALAAGRPLLLRGEPGVGKSQLARAIAQVAGRRFIAIVVQPDTEYQDLLWAIDHTQRLADAQLASVTKDVAGIGDMARYVGPGPLWWALNWRDASRRSCRSNYAPPDDPDAPDAMSAGVVLLIDEIDKADIALANGLLEVLGNRRFAVPPLGDTVHADGVEPLVVLTSNDTRELPAALLRRCVVLDMALPDDLFAHFVAIGRTHFPDADDALLEGAAQQILDDRARCHEPPKTGLAEYLDLVRAVQALQCTDAEREAWLTRLAGYFHKSHAIPR